MISIIIPVYNCKEYLPRCVDSLRRQTYEALQIILVDDGSADGSAAVCDALAAQDGRITVIHRPNGGVSAARNAGLLAAAGEYVTFADADDYLNPDHIMRLYTAIQTYGCDVAVSGYVSEEDSHASPPDVTDHSPEPLQLDHDGAVCELLAGGAVGGYVWNKLYRRELLEGERFERGVKILEDLLFNYRVFQNVRSAVFIGGQSYHYIQRGQSAMHRQFGSEHVSMVETARRIRSDTAGGSKALRDAGKGLLATTILWVVDVMAEYGPYDAERVRQYQAEFKPLLGTYLRLGRVPLTYRMSAVFFCMGYGVYKRAVKLARKLLR